MMLNTRIVLMNPTHPGNIGAAARAMKNMGLSELYLVKPKLFPHHDATVRASGADDILQKAVVVDTLPAALVGCERVYATSARSRRLEWPLCTPREAAEQMKVQTELKSCVIFGRESSGLTNEELSLAQTHISIPTEESFSSLNLAQAVQVIVYEIYASRNENQSVQNKASDELATVDDQNGFLDHLRELMIHVNFLNPRQPRKLMQRVRRLFQRAEMSKTEVNILRGFLSAVDKKIK
jgi:tRNA (cytidine32/uridine32-2'-O)-methyltransferase